MKTDSNETPRSRYGESLQYLYRQLPMFSRVGAAAYKPGLDTSLRLDSHFGHPHRKFKSIHVGGTNGKGSTSHSLAAILQRHGYKTGLYTSPHLIDFRERIRVNGEMIPEEEVTRFVEQWRACGYDGHPSFFELTMIMAFDWFARCGVDYAVIEVGMGGRLDSTNIITPEVCVITNISPDHMQFLGDTLPRIAAEKAGIIKPGIPVVIGEAEDEVREVFEGKAAETGAPITFAEDQPLLATAVEDDACAGWTCSTTTGLRFDVPLAGDYQTKNINTVLHAVEAMRGAGIAIDDADIMEGLSHVTELTGLHGRWEVMERNPLVIADTGHNEAGVRYNMAQLARVLARRREKDPEAALRMVIGFVADKDIEHIIGLLPEDATYYLTNASIPRALPVDRLLPYFSNRGLKATAYPDVATAFEAARAATSTDDIVYVGGSTFIVADYLASRPKECDR